MIKQEVLSEGITGVRVEFTNQELRVIKDKWGEISKEIDDINIRDVHKRIRVKECFVIDMTILLDKILGNIPTDKEVHDALFIENGDVIA